MEDIDFVLTAKNDCQDMKLSLTTDEGEFWFTLWGNYRGDERFQIDFDTMTKQELSDLRTAIDTILNVGEDTEGTILIACPDCDGRGTNDDESEICVKCNASGEVRVKEENELSTCPHSI